MLEAKKNDILRVLSNQDIAFEMVAYELYHMIFLSTPTELREELFQFLCQQFDRMDEPIDDHGYVLCAPANLENDAKPSVQEQIDYIRMLLSLKNEFLPEHFLGAVEVVYVYIGTLAPEKKFSYFVMFLQSGFFPYGKNYIPILEINPEDQPKQEELVQIISRYEYLLWIRYSNPDAMIHVTLAMLDDFPGEKNKLVRREILDCLTQLYLEIGREEAELEEQQAEPGEEIKKASEFISKTAVNKGQGD